MFCTIYRNVYLNLQIYFVGIVFLKVFSVCGNIEDTGYFSTPRSSDTIQSKKWDPVRSGLYSSLLPGAGQCYTGHYIKGGMFLAAEIITASVANFWYKSYNDNLDEARFHAKSLAFAPKWDDSVMIQENVLIYKYEALKSKYTMHNALSWMIGAYIYNIGDAVKNSRYFESDLPKSALKAGWLSAIPGLGLGQFYNGEYSKSGIIIMTQFSLGLIVLHNDRLMKKAERNYKRVFSIKDSTGATPVANEYKENWNSYRQNAFKDRNTYLWYSLFFYFYGILDAVVDAHLHDYNGKIEVYPDLVPEKEMLGITIRYGF